MIAAFGLVLVLALGLACSTARAAEHQKPEDFFVASGRFGAVLFFFLSVGETYSIGTILGVPAGVYSHGTGFLAWFLGYILLAFPVGYFLNPCIWRAGRRTGAVTLPDMFRRHFDSRTLELVITLSSIAFLLPLGVMQFVGLQTVLSALGLGHLPPLLTLGVAGALVLLMVAIAGIRGPARVAVLKDALMLLAVLAAGLAALSVLLRMPAAPAAAPMAAPKLPGAQWKTDLFAMSTIVLQSVGFCLVPQTVASVFTARSPRTVRRAQSLMPLYMAMFPLLVLTAYAARRLGGGAGTGDPNGVFVRIACDLLPGWMAGIVLAAASLSAMVVLSGICLALGPLVSRNLVPGLDGERQKRYARLVMAGYMVLSVAGATGFHGLMTAINTVFYFGITQILPALVSMLFLRRVRPGAIALSLLLGDAVSIGLHAGGVPLGGINPGLVGLGANALLLLLLTRRFPGEFREPTENRRLRSDPERVSPVAQKEIRHDAIA
ncbi:sodium:solute symporter [Acetobacteraceae bacterium KSS8]|uniref:Sodium:solute symporter n=1 Tax=Endosaccharibacter trunci TaxID=2812733 RepID=A0ABT1WAU4_9PROT|nr:sodium:solute symporter [Acetobacteraceae bacterium KSS8]